MQFLKRSPLLTAFAIFVLLAAIGWGGFAWSWPGPQQPTRAVPTPPAVPTPTAVEVSAPPSPLVAPSPARPPVYGYRVLSVLPHDPQAFTQGLDFADGVLYEGTGLYGASSLRRVELESGRVLQQHDLDAAYFGEGISVLGDRIYQLTWQNGVGFVSDRESFQPVQQFSYPTEGWGLTHDGEQLILSDGTATLYFLDPATLQETGRVTVTLAGERVTRLNELEYVDGKVLANVWQTDSVLRIDPATGQVDALYDFSGLLSQAPPFTGTVDVLNGIAFEEQKGRLFVTGKLWPALFEVELVPR